MQTSSDIGVAQQKDVCKTVQNPPDFLLMGFVETIILGDFFCVVSACVICEHEKELLAWRTKKQKLYYNYFLLHQQQ